MVRTEFIPEGSYQRPEKYSVFYGNRNASVCHAHSLSLNFGSVLGYMDKLETFSLDLFPYFVDGYLMQFFHALQAAYRVHPTRSRAVPIYHLPCLRSKRSIGR